MTHKHIDHLPGIIRMVRMICQFMDHGEYKGESREIIRHKGTFFDIRSTKADQFGFRMDLGNGKMFT